VKESKLKQLSIVKEGIEDCEMAESTIVKSPKKHVNLFYSLDCQELANKVASHSQNNITLQNIKWRLTYVTSSLFVSVSLYCINLFMLCFFFVAYIYVSLNTDFFFQGLALDNNLFVGCTVA
jgi:hypothetical protein